jgi:hypothetical protein
VGRVVFVATNEAHGNLLRDRLAARGIDVEVSGTWRAALRGALPLSETSVALEVLDEAAAPAARAALAEIEAEVDVGDATWTCPRCGADVPVSFDVCWRCGDEASERPPLTAAAPTAPPSPAPESRRRAFHDLLWAIGAGCVPVALTAVLLSPVRFHPRWLSDVGLVGFDNLALGVGLALCVGLLKRRGFDARAAWGGRERWLGDLLGGVLLGCVIVAIHWGVWVTMWSLGVREQSLARQPSANLWLDFVFLMFPGVCVAASQGSLILYGFVLARARVLTGSRVAAVAITAGLAVLTWATQASASGRIIVALEAVLISVAALALRRVWPLVVAGVFGYVAVWLPLLVTGK